MVTRTFIFCDICNPRGLRHIGKQPANEPGPTGQPAWFEGHVEQAAKLGWLTTDTGLNVCPRCAKKIHTT